MLPTNQALLNRVNEKTNPQSKQGSLLKRLIKNETPGAIQRHRKELNLPYVVAAEWDYTAHRMNQGRGDIVYSSKSFFNTPSSIREMATVGRPVTTHLPSVVLIVELKV